VGEEGLGLGERVHDPRKSKGEDEDDVRWGGKRGLQSPKR